MLTSSSLPSNTNSQRNAQHLCIYLYYPFAILVYFDVTVLSLSFRLDFYRDRSLSYYPHYYCTRLQLLDQLSFSLLFVCFFLFTFLRVRHTWLPLQLIIHTYTYIHLFPALLGSSHLSRSNSSSYLGNIIVPFAVHYTCSTLRLRYAVLVLFYDQTLYSMSVC